MNMLQENLLAFRIQTSAEIQNIPTRSEPFIFPKLNVMLWRIVNEDIGDKIRRKLELSTRENMKRVAK